MLLESTNILPIIMAGLMNGSFVIPARYIKNFTNEKVWLCHSIVGMAIIPWLILALIFPEAIQNYLSLSPSILLFLIFSGVIFGIGQVCFSYAIESIGIALSFAINLSIGVTIGSMFVVFDKGVFFTTQGYFVTLAIFFILCSLVLYYYAGKSGKNHQNHAVVGSNYHRGWLLASLTGLTSGLQNITFITVAFHTTSHFQTNNSFWVWPPFLLMAAIPMLLGFLYRIKKNQASTIGHTIATRSLAIKNIFLISLMGLFFTGSLALYSGGMSKLTHQQQIIGWPAFMVSIILISQIWGWLYRESNDTTIKSRFNMLGSIALLVVAIIILAFEA